MAREGLSLRKEPTRSCSPKRGNTANCITFNFFKLPSKILRRCFIKQGTEIPMLSYMVTAFESVHCSRRA